MAEVVKTKEKKQIVKIEEEKQNKENKLSKGENKDKNKNKNVSTKEEKKSLWARFLIFCNGVKSEFKKVRWTSKKDMVKYSIATIVFIVFCSVFFYGIDTIFALVQSLFN